MMGIGVPTANIGKMAPNRLRMIVLAAMAEAANIKYVSAMPISISSTNVIDSSETTCQ